VIEIPFTPENSYPIHVISNEAAEHLYQFTKLFWKNRLDQDYTEPEVESLIKIYRQSYLQSHLGSFRDAIVHQVKASLDAKDRPSILELGCANGPMLHFLKDHVDLDLIRYVGIDMWHAYQDDFQRHFGKESFILGDVDDFIDMELSDLGGEPFTVFVASNTLYMIEPGRVRKTIHKAAELCHNIILHDIILNLTGDISSSGAVIIPYNPDGIQVYFANPLKIFLDEAGFEIKGLWEVSHPDGKRGHAVIHGQRGEG